MTPQGEGRIVGVVRDMTYVALKERPDPTVFYPYRQRPRGIGRVYVEVRTAVNPMTVLPAVRKLVLNVDRRRSAEPGPRRLGPTLRVRGSAVPNPRNTERRSGAPTPASGGTRRTAATRTRFPAWPLPGGILSNPGAIPSILALHGQVIVPTGVAVPKNRLGLGPRPTTCVYRQLRLASSHEKPPSS